MDFLLSKSGCFGVVNYHIQLNYFPDETGLWLTVVTIVGIIRTVA